MHTSYEIESLNKDGLVPVSMTAIAGAGSAAIAAEGKKVLIASIRTETERHLFMSLESHTIPIVRAFLHAKWFFAI